MRIFLQPFLLTPFALGSLLPPLSDNLGRALYNWVLFNGPLAGVPVLRERKVKRALLADLAGGLGIDNAR